MHFRLVLALLVALPGMALAADGSACQSMPDDFLKIMDRLDELVTIVPPDEDKYIGDEYSAAMKVQSTARINAVMRRPLFWASRLHGEVDWGRSTAKMLTVGNLPPKDKVKSAALLPYHVMTIKESFDELLDHDSAKTVDRMEGARATLQLTQELNEIQQYIACWVDRI